MGGRVGGRGRGRCDDMCLLDREKQARANEARHIEAQLGGWNSPAHLRSRVAAELRRRQRRSRWGWWWDSAEPDALDNIVVTESNRGGFDLRSYRARERLWLSPNIGRDLRRNSASVYNQQWQPNRART